MNNDDSFVRILFHGLFIIAANGNPAEANSYPRWEVGLPETPNHPHDFSVLLREIKGSGAKLITVTLPTNPDTPITVKPRPAPPLAQKFQNNFNRLKDTGDPEDYQWIIDMENGGEFHGKKLRKTSNMYKRKIFIEGGMLYTYAKTVESYKRFKVPNLDVRTLGRFAAVVGIEVGRAVGSSVILNEGSSSAITRTQESGVRYELVFRHLPQQSGESRGSHFPFFYNVLADPDNPDSNKFDVIHIDEEPRTSGRHEHGEEGQHQHEEGVGPSQISTSNALMAVEPQVCNAVWLSKQESGLPS